MEVKEWTYTDFPACEVIPEGAIVMDTTGDEVAARYLHNVEYCVANGTPLHLQILTPSTRKRPYKQPESWMPPCSNTCTEEETPLPCVVWVQGSAWFEQDCYEQIPMFAKLAEMGYVVAVVEYRHSGIAPFPAQAIDACNAIRFLKQNAAKYYIDPERMTIAGDSSGGHTAMWTQMLNNDDTPDNLFPGISAKVKNIVNYYGSVSVMLEDGNPTTINHHLPDSPEGMEMGGVNLFEHPELCRKLSVECNLEGKQLPPTMIVHGTKDRTCSMMQSVNLYNKMKELDMDVIFVIQKGSDHGGPSFWVPEMLQMVDSFIRKNY